MNEQFSLALKPRDTEFEMPAACEGTERAYRRDVAVFEAWYCIRFDTNRIALPLSDAIPLAFVQDQLAGFTDVQIKRMRERGINVRMPRPSIATIRRRLSALSVFLTLKGQSMAVETPAIKLLLRRHRRVEASQHRPQRAITADVLMRMVATCNETLHGRRDRALLLVGFALGGRRRSELAALITDDVIRADHGHWIRLTAFKTDRWSEGELMPLTGAASDALARWLEVLDSPGNIFRGIGSGGQLSPSLSDRGINRIVKRRAAQAGLNPDEYGAHSLRSGFMTEAGLQGISLAEAMHCSGHRNPAVALRYYRPGQRLATQMQVLRAGEAPPAITNTRRIA